MVLVLLLVRPDDDIRLIVSNDVSLFLPCRPLTEVAVRDVERIVTAIWPAFRVRGALLAKGPDSSLGEVHSGSCSGNIHMEEEKV